MLNKTYLLGLAVIAGFTSLFCFAQTPSNDSGSAEPSLQSTIEELVRADEFKKAEREKLDALPKEAVTILTQQLKEQPSTGPGTGRLFDLLAVKTKQFDTQLTENMRASAIDTLVKKCESTRGAELQYRLSALIGLKDPKIVAMADRFTSDSDPKVKKAASRLLEQTQ